MRLLKKNVCFFIPLFFILFSVSIASCKSDLFCDEVIFTLPDITNLPEKIELTSWKIQIVCGDTIKEISLTPDTCSFSIEKSFLSPVYPSAIIAYPETNCQNWKEQFFFPCGTIFPYSKDLSWKEGFSADILKKYYFACTNLQNATMDILNYAVHFNWCKFSQSLPDYPWLLDSDIILNGIFCGEFSSSYLKPKGIQNVRLDTIKNILNLSDFIIVPQYYPLICTDTAEIIFSLKINTYSTHILIEKNCKFCTTFLDDTKKLTLELNSFPI